jgi:hypothetical protein
MAQPSVLMPVLWGAISPNIGSDLDHGYFLLFGSRGRPATPPKPKVQTAHYSVCAIASDAQQAPAADIHWWYPYG